MNELLQQVLNLPEFKNFKKLSENDYRDVTTPNSCFSLSTRGWYNHTTEESGSLELLLPKLDVDGIYENSKKEVVTIKNYFKTRGINITIKNINELGVRVNRYYNKEGVPKVSIITPMFDSSNNLIHLHKIYIDSDFKKVEKSRLLGKNIKYVACAIIIKKPGKKKLVIEGLEDGLIVESRYPDHTIIITCGAKRAKIIKSLLGNGKDTILILDNDESKTSLKYSFHYGSVVKRLIPKLLNQDANDALLIDDLDNWFRNLSEIEFSKAEELITDYNDKMNAVLDEFNQKHAVISIQGKVVIMNDEIDASFNRQVVTFSSQTDFQLRYSNRCIGVGTQKGELKQIPISKLWLADNKRRQFDGLCFNPSEENTDDNFFNVWRGFAYDENPKGDCSLYYQHIFNNIAKKNKIIYEYVLNWLAHGIQEPIKKPGVCFIIRGGQGTGKGVFINHYRKLFGQHGLYIRDVKHLVGSFNAHLKECLLLFADEMFISGDKSDNNTLKGLVSENETQIEYKGKDVFSFPSYTRIMMSSNETYVAPLDTDDRRYFILDIGQGDCKNYPFFKKMENDMVNGGYCKLLYDLMHRDLTRVEIKNFPETKAIMENKLGSMDTVQQWLYNHLIEGSFPVQDQIEKLYNDYKQSCGSDMRHESKHQWSHIIKKYIPSIKTVHVFGHTGRHYNFPTLNIGKKEFSKNTGLNLT